MNKIDWKRKLSSRKFWALVAGFVSGLVIFFGFSTGTAERVSSLILSGGSIVVYMLAKCIADANYVPPTNADAVSQTTIGFDTSDTEDNDPDDSKIKIHKTKCPY
jgi:hypothetical protein